MGGFTLPISISYHASGARPDEVPTCVGLGWTLNAGGAVTRTILGGPDMEIASAYGGDHRYYNRSAVDNLINEVRNNRGNGHLRQLTNPMHSMDSESDRYCFNAGGHTGVFRYSYKDGKFVTLDGSSCIFDSFNYGSDSYFLMYAPDNAIYRFSVHEKTGPDPDEEYDSGVLPQLHPDSLSKHLSYLCIQSNYEVVPRTRQYKTVHSSPIVTANSESATGLQTGSVVYATDGTRSLSAIYYDAKGRVIENREVTNFGTQRVTTNTYTYSGQPLKTTMTEGDESVITENTYHQTSGLLLYTEVTVNGTKQRVSSVAYDDLGRIASVTRGAATKSGGTVSYKYNLHGQTTEISGPGFAQNLFYADGPGKKLYNGSVSAMTWTMGTDTRVRGYKYTYNGYGWLTAAEYGENQDLWANQHRYTERFLDFMLNGGVRRLQRHGLKADGVHGKVDNLHITYDGNRIKTVIEDADPVTQNGSMDYPGNNRAVINGTSGDIDQTIAYYPYGGVIADLGTPTTGQPYKFGGKELITANGLNEYDFGARRYYQAVSHFTSIDPMADKYPWHSPYLFWPTEFLGKYRSISVCNTFRVKKEMLKANPRRLLARACE